MGMNSIPCVEKTPLFPLGPLVKNQCTQNLTLYLCK